MIVLVVALLQHIMGAPPLVNLDRLSQQIIIHVDGGVPNLKLAIVLC
jgi:hypothetical protein